jgi:hypothetical protein
LSDAAPPQHDRAIPEQKLRYQLQTGSSATRGYTAGELRFSQDWETATSLQMPLTARGRVASETERHIEEAFRLSPRDTFAFLWMTWVGCAKLQLNADTEAVTWLRRSLDANRTFSFGHFLLAAALVRIAELDQAHAAVQAGLALDPSFTVRRMIDNVHSRGLSDPAFLAGVERFVEGMRLAGVPEG